MTTLGGEAYPELMVHDSKPVRDSLYWGVTLIDTGCLGAVWLAEVAVKDVVCWLEKGLEQAVGGWGWGGRMSMAGLLFS